MKLKVVPLENGTVIDHISLDQGRIVYRLLRSKITDHPTVLLLNIPSSSQSKKDMLKIENVFVDKVDCDIIALVSPNATINTIKNGKVVDKYNVKLPEHLHGFLKCLNPNCITNREREPLETNFAVSSNPLKLVCVYCDKEYDERLVSHIVG